MEKGLTEQWAELEPQLHADRMDYGTSIVRVTAEGVERICPADMWITAEEQRALTEPSPSPSPTP